MIKQKMKIRDSAARALFDSNLPFKGRREQPKNQYRRQPKHRAREQ